MCSLHVTTLIKDNTNIFYTMEICKMGLRGPKSMRKVDDPSIIFIDFYVPALTHINSTETSLQLSEKVTLFAVCRIYAGIISKET
jgi:hypothetical protein